MQDVSKFANEVTAASLDASGVTTDKEFMTAIMILQPVSPLEEKGVIRVKEVAAPLDKAVFTVMTDSTLSFTTVDARGGEVSTCGSNSTITAPTFVEVQPVTKSATVFIHDNVDLVNPVQFKEIAQVAATATKRQKIKDAVVELETMGNYTAGTSIRNAGGFTAKGAVANTDQLIPNDLSAAKSDIKANLGLIADVILVHSNQLVQLTSHADFAPGSTTSSNFRKAKWDADGNLVRFDGMEIIEVIELNLQTAGDFTGSPGYNGHYAFVGIKNLILARGENNKKNKVEDFRQPCQHGTQRTIDINYDYALIYPAAVRVLQCYQ